MKQIFILFILIFCFKAEIMESVYKLDVENKTTLSFFYKEGLRQEVRPVDEDGNVVFINTANFEHFLEQSRKFYLRYKVFPLNQRDKCYAKLDIDTHTVPVLIHNRECLEIRGKTTDFMVKAVKILFIWGLFSPLIGSIINILLMLFIFISNSVFGKNKSDSQ